MADTTGREQDEVDEEEQELQVMKDEDEDGSAGSNHTLTLIPATISIKAEIFCLAFSDDGRWVGYSEAETEPTGLLAGRSMPIQRNFGPASAGLQQAVVGSLSLP